MSVILQKLKQKAAELAQTIDLEKGKEISLAKDPSIPPYQSERFPLSTANPLPPIKQKGKLFVHIGKKKKQNAMSATSAPLLPLDVETFEKERQLFHKQRQSKKELTTDEPNKKESASLSSPMETMSKALLSPVQGTPSDHVVADVPSKQLVELTDGSQVKHLSISSRCGLEGWASRYPNLTWIEIHDTKHADRLRWEEEIKSYTKLEQITVHVTDGFPVDFSGLRIKRLMVYGAVARFPTYVYADLCLVRYSEPHAGSLLSFLKHLPTPLRRFSVTFMDGVSPYSSHHVQLLLCGAVATDLFEWRSPQQKQLKWFAVPQKISIPILRIGSPAVAFGLMTNEFYRKHIDWSHTKELQICLPQFSECTDAFLELFHSFLDVVLNPNLQTLSFTSSAYKYLEAALDRSLIYIATAPKSSSQKRCLRLALASANLQPRFSKQTNTLPPTDFAKLSNEHAVLLKPNSKIHRHSTKVVKETELSDHFYLFDAKGVSFDSGHQLILM
jgi:hypothetical protein